MFTTRPTASRTGVPVRSAGPRPRVVAQPAASSARAAAATAAARGGWFLGIMILLVRGLEALQELDQVPPLGLAQARAVGVAGVGVAGQGGVELEGLRGGRGVEADVDRIELPAADVELLGPLVRGEEELPEARHRAVVEVGRGGPHPVERPGLVGTDVEVLVQPDVDEVLDGRPEQLERMPQHRAHHDVVEDLAARGFSPQGLAGDDELLAPSRRPLLPMREAKLSAVRGSVPTWSAGTMTTLILRAGSVGLI